MSLYSAFPHRLAWLPPPESILCSLTVKPTPEVIRELVAVCHRASRGDLEARACPAPEDPQFAELATAINRLLDISDAYVRESAAAMEHCAQGEFHRPILLDGLSGSYRHAATTINRAALKMQHDSQMIRRFEKERAAVARRVTATTESVAQSSEKLRGTAASIQTHVGESRDLSADVARAADDAANNVSGVAAACQELSACLAEITRRTDESSGLTRTAVTEATEAQQVVHDLGEAASKVGSVVDVISKIARQTNLLALNATIEAARAGEHGRSFAVVAGEVKLLSRETAEATEQIAEQISSMQSATQSVSKVIGGVGNSIGSIDESAAAISTSVSEQSKAVEEIAERIAHVSTATTSISDRMSQVATSAENLDQITRGLTTSADQLAADSLTLRRETQALDASGESSVEPRAA